MHSSFLIAAPNPFRVCHAKRRALSFRVASYVFLNKAKNLNEKILRPSGPQDDRGCFVIRNAAKNLKRKALLAGKARPDGSSDRLVLFSHPVSFAKRNGDVSPKKRRGTFAKPSPAPPPANRVLRLNPGNGPMGPRIVFRCRWGGGRPPRAGSLPSRRQRKIHLIPGGECIIISVYKKA